METSRNGPGHLPAKGDQILQICSSQVETLIDQTMRVLNDHMPMDFDMSNIKEQCVFAQKSEFKVPPLSVFLLQVTSAKPFLFLF